MNGVVALGITMTRIDCLPKKTGVPLGRVPRCTAPHQVPAGGQLFFLAPRCLGKSREVRPSVSKAKETTGMYNGPLNKYPKGELSNKKN